MKIIDNKGVVCVLTSESIDQIKEQGGSQAWKLNTKRISKCKYQYVVCIQNCANTHEGGVQASHHSAFLVGRLKEVLPSNEYKGRQALQFSEYAEIAIGNAWPGHRYPVWYTDFEKLGIKLADLKFRAV